MKKFEYKIFTTNRELDLYDLNRRGLNGWELIIKELIVDDKEQEYFIYTFKREVKE